MPQTQPLRRIERALSVAGKAKSRDGRLDPKTIKVYGKKWQEFQAWRRKKGLSTAIPATSETLAEYAEALLEHGYARSTAEGRIAAVKAKHRERGWPVPDGVAAWYVLRGADLTPAEPRKVNTPARRAALAAIADVCDVDTPAGARNLCLASLAWDLLAGESALVALDLSDVEIVEGGLIVRVAGGWSAVSHDHDPPEICPVEATVRWIGVLRSAGAVSGPLFRSIDKAGNIGGCGPKAGTAGVGGRLNPRGLQRIWARLVARAGLPPSTPRALRIGGAVDDLAEGARLMQVLARARWSPNNVAAVRRLTQAESES